MDRALREFRIRGVATNLTFLENLIDHPRFRHATTPRALSIRTAGAVRRVKRRDRATRLLRFIGDVSVNGHPEWQGAPATSAADHLVRHRTRVCPRPSRTDTRQLLERDSARIASRRWMRAKSASCSPIPRCAMPTMVFATRMRCYDMSEDGAVLRARACQQLLSLECWGGATFDVAMRFSSEDPWERLISIAPTYPQPLLQILLRAANGVGYTNYPDNVVRYFVERRRAAGSICFVYSTSLNWVDNMRGSMDAVIEPDKLCEAAICYTGDMFDPIPIESTISSLLPGPGARIRGSRRTYPGARGYGRGDETGGRLYGPVPGTLRNASQTSLSISTRTIPAGISASHRTRLGRRWRRCRGRCYGCALGHDVAALPRRSRRGSARDTARPRDSISRRSGRFRFIGKPCAINTPHSNRI